MDGVCPSSVPSNFWELPKNGWSLSIVRAVQFLGASKKGTVSVCRPFRPIFGSFQKMDGVCPSSVPSNFWELPKNGRGLSVTRPVLFLGASKKWKGSVPHPLLLYNSGVDIICAVNVPSRYGPFVDAAFVNSAFVDNAFVNNAIVNGASVHAAFVDGAFTQAALVDAVIVDGASAPSSTL